MRVGVSKLDSIHYLHSYAVADRIDFSNLSECTIQTKQTDVTQVAILQLPCSEDDLAIRDNISMIISCILFKNLSFFGLSFDGVVKWHLKQEFYDEMSTKSDVVSAFSFEWY